MPKYACGNPARVGDVVRCRGPGTQLLRVGEQYNVTGVDASVWVFIPDHCSLNYSSDCFQLVRRQSQEETMIDKYASGEEPLVGDVVYCVDDGGGGGGLKNETVHVVKTVYPNAGIEVDITPGFHWASRFKLNRRKEQPMPENPPLVKWPEEEKQLTWVDLEAGALFIFDIAPRESQTINVRRMSGWSAWLYQSGTPLIAEDRMDQPHNPVRRLKMIRQPVFEVI